jgi:hypothetical protein
MGKPKNIEAVEAFIRRWQGRDAKHGFPHLGETSCRHQSPPARQTSSFVK